MILGSLRCFQIERRSDLPKGKGRPAGLEARGPPGLPLFDAGETTGTREPAAPHWPQPRLGASPSSFWTSPFEETAGRPRPLGKLPIAGFQSVLVPLVPACWRRDPGAWSAKPVRRQPALSNADTLPGAGWPIPKGQSLQPVPGPNHPASVPVLGN